MKKYIQAILIGSTSMVIADLLISRLTNSMHIAMPLSVFIGAFIAGLIAKSRYWLVGLIVGCVNISISLIIYMLLSPGEALHEAGLSAINVLGHPIFYSIVFGVIGGTISGFIKVNFSAEKPKIKSV